MPTENNPPAPGALSPDEKAARSDLTKFLTDVGNIAADKVNPMFKSRYSSLAEITETIKPTLKKHRLAFTQRLFNEGDKVGVESFFLHDNGTVIEAGRLSIKGDNLDPQKLGSALTYLKKFLITTACLISTDVDDDGNAAARPVNLAPPTAKAAPSFSKPSPFDK